MTISPFLRQMRAVTGALILSMGMSAVLGYSSILIPQLELRTSRLRLKNEREVSIVASIAALPLALGSILNGYLMEKYGRKSALIISQIPTPGWLIIAFSTNVYTLYLGRFLTGWSAGMCSGLLNVYVAEIASTKHRSILLAFLNLSVNIGIIFCHLLGTFLSWNTSAVVIFVLCIVGTVFMIFSPETPFWLITNNKPEKCLKRFAYLRGGSSEGSNDNFINTPEYQGLVQKAEHMKSMEKNFRYYLNCFVRPEFYKPLIISTIFFLIAQFSGISAVTFYSMTIFQEVLGPEVPGHAAMFLVDLLRFFWSLVTIFLMFYLSRRFLAILSGVGVTFSLLVLSIYSIICDSFGFEILYGISGCCVVSYISFMSMGFIPLPWCMLGELFSADNKGFGAGIATTISYLAAFCVVKTVPFMFSWIGAEGTFLIYGICALSGTVFLFFFLPETKHKTFAEIEQSYKGHHQLQTTESIQISSQNIRNSAESNQIPKENKTSAEIEQSYKGRNQLQTTESVQISSQNIPNSAERNQIPKED